jgi:hypothetical protein
MADINETQQSEVVRIGNPDEANFVEVNSESNLKSIDTPESGLSATLSLTTTAIELKVGANAKANRRLIEMQALTKNVKWGYNTNCDFDLFKNQFFSLPCGENCTLYLKASIGTASIAVSEK